jgi:hypothetical protein
MFYCITVNWPTVAGTELHVNVHVCVCMHVCMRPLSYTFEDKDAKEI